MATQLKNNLGFSFVEAILAIALFGLIATGLVGALISGYFDVFLAGGNQRATLLAEEGLEAARNIRDSGYGNLAVGTHGIGVSGNNYVFSGASDVVDGYTRQVVVTAPSANRKLVTSTVSWVQQEGRNGTVTVSTYLNNWQAVTGTKKGLLVYGEGGLASDTIRYRVLNSSGSWGVVGTAADIDGLSTNRALRVANLYASATRDEKILISKHYATATTTQYIYAQVFNGTTWGNVINLTSYTSATNIDVKNFGGAYLNNGDFMLVYSDNATNIPKFVTWNGTTWAAAQNTQNIGGIARAIVVKARPATNEVMAVFFDSANDTNSLYFNGGAYAPASWTGLTEHGINAPSTNKALIDFEWSVNTPTFGGLIYTNNRTERSFRLREFTADGAGSGVWGAVANATNQPAGRNIGTMRLSARAGANEFLACNKDQNAAPQIRCYEGDHTPAWINPTNQNLGSTDTGIQRSFDLAYEKSGTDALVIYSDTTTVPKLKKYNPSTNTFDIAATNLTAMTAAVETVKLIPSPDADDIMVLIGDTAQNLRSEVWNGATNSFYVTPSGWAATTQGTSGSSDEDYWYDFVWDKF